MKEYKFNVTVTETYSKEFTISTDTEEQARELLDNDLEACPLDTQSGTFEGSDTSIDLIND